MKEPHPQANWVYATHTRYESGGRVHCPGSGSLVPRAALEAVLKAAEAQVVERGRKQEDAVVAFTLASQNLERASELLHRNRLRVREVQEALNLSTKATP